MYYLFYLFKFYFNINTLIHIKYNKILLSLIILYITLRQKKTTTNSFWALLLILESRERSWTTENLSKPIQIMFNNVITCLNIFLSHTSIFIFSSQNLI